MKTKNKYASHFTINGKKIGEGQPTYFIADIAANHNGSLAKAKELIFLAKKAGADAAKFQHFRAEKIVSQYGFESLGRSKSHQAKWKKSVFEVYRAASVPWKWTEELKRCCERAGIDFFSAPYDFEAIDMLDAHMPAYKIGSGDLNWTEALVRMAKKKKPVFLATGASEMAEVRKAVRKISAINPKLCLMQCNTNYTGSLENFRHVNLNVLKSYARQFPGIMLGLSDHTPGHATVLGAVALGARAIEKHFTDRKDQEGPDHPFSMDPRDWREMVDRTRELELALGDGIKKIEENETETVLIQRRCLRAARELSAGHLLRKEDIDVLRPSTGEACQPDGLSGLLGKRLACPMPKGKEITRASLRKS